MGISGHNESKVTPKSTYYAQRMGVTTNTARDQGKEEASHLTAASSENKGLHKTVSKDPYGSDMQKCQKRAGVGMEVI